MTNDLDFLAALLHGRRSKLAESERLDALCGIRSLPDLFGAIYPETAFGGVQGFERRLTQDLVEEFSRILAYLAGSDSRLLGWMIARFKVENLKVLLRGIMTGKPIQGLLPYLVPLSSELKIDLESLSEPATLEKLAMLLPGNTLTKNFLSLLEIYRDRPRSFHLEAALDCAYYQELMAILLGEEKAREIRDLICQEADTFHLNLALRGKFHYGLPAKELLPMHIEGTRISRARFAAMLADPDLSTAAGRAVGRALDGLPASADISRIERLAWDRYWRLSNQAFRRETIGFGAVMGYWGLRRVEVANLITICEGIRANLSPEAIRERLIPGKPMEASHV